MSATNPYDSPGLDEINVDPNPFKQFEVWFREAEVSVPILPNAMTLATATPEGIPSARVVLLKDFDEHGFVFYTNYGSQKSGELEANPNAALNFYWAELARQVRITGMISRTSRSESETYFHTRPIDSQLGAWASNQSEVIPNREILERRMEEYARRFEGKVIDLPPNWGGYRLAPNSIEFWQGRPSRLHDRIRYRRRGELIWMIERIAP